MALGKKTTASVSHDILKEKQQEISRLEQQADDAVEIVTRTISRLELINQQIDDGMTEIDVYMEDLAKTRETMSERRRNNAAIISNFSKLLDPNYSEESAHTSNETAG